MAFHCLYPMGLILAADSEHKPPAFRELYIPANDKEKNIPDTIPSFITDEKILYYYDGARGPLRAFDLVTFVPLWTWEIPGQGWKVGSGKRLWFCGVDEKNIFISTRSVRDFTKFSLYAIDCNKGSIAWGKENIPGAIIIDDIAIIDGMILRPTLESKLEARSTKTGDVVFLRQNARLTADGADRKKDAGIFEGARNHSPKVLYWSDDNDLGCFGASDGSCLWYRQLWNLSLDYHVIELDDYESQKVIPFINDRVFLLWKGRRHDAGVLFSLDAAGNVMWKFHGVYSFAASVGNTEAYAIYEDTNNHGVCCIDGKTGAIQWRYTTKTGRQSRCNYSEKSIYVYVPPAWDSKDKTRFIALDRKSGAVTWVDEIEGILHQAAVTMNDKMILGYTKKEERDQSTTIRVYDLSTMK